MNGRPRRRVERCVELIERSKNEVPAELSTTDPCTEFADDVIPANDGSHDV